MELWWARGGDGGVKESFLVGVFEVVDVVFAFVVGVGWCRGWIVWLVVCVGVSVGDIVGEDGKGPLCVFVQW